MSKFNVYFKYLGLEYQIRDMMDFEGLNIETKRVKDQAYYSTNLTGTINFIQRDNCDIFNILKGFTEDKTKYCEIVTVRIEKLCENQVFSSYLIGDFTANKIIIDYCTCKIQVEVRTIDDFTCLTDNWEDELNFYTQQTFPYEKQLGTVFIRVISFLNTLAAPGTPVLPDNGIPVQVDDGVINVSPYGGPDCDPNNLEWDDVGKAWVAARCPSQWWLKDTGMFVISPAAGTFSIVSTFAREFFVSVLSPGPEWINIGGNDWVRQSPTKVDMPGTQTQGMSFNASFQLLVENIGCFSNLVSDFFNINRDFTAPTNTAYDFAIANLYDLVIVAQSDIKNPTASTPAQAQLFKAALKDWLEDMQNLFNIVWFVQDDGVGGSNLRVEHVSYLTDAIAIDICNDPCEIINKLLVPDRENFATKEAQSVFFNGDPIIYQTPCGNETKDYKTKLFNTDPIFIEDNPDSFVNDGFVLVATTVISGTRYLNNYNKGLAFPNLHSNLWIYDRFFFEGNMNGVTTAFLTTKKIRQSQELICNCQLALMTGNEIISTTIGDGQIETIKENLLDNSLRIQLNFE